MLARADAADPSGNMLEAYTGRRPDAVQQQAAPPAPAPAPAATDGVSVVFSLAALSLSLQIRQ